MKNKSKNIRKKTRKRTRKKIRRKPKGMLQMIHSNKTSFLIFSVALSLLIIIGSTYAWVTYSDKRINRMENKNEKLQASIKEEFTEKLDFAPGEKTTKKVSVENEGEFKALVRLSLYEFLATFELDMADGENQANSKLKETPKTELSSEVKYATFEDQSTWDAKNYVAINNETYVQMKNVEKSDTKDIGTAYQYDGNNQSGKLAYLTIGFNNNNIYDVNRRPPIGTIDYWYYSDGYFYYSEVLKQSETTTNLMEEVGLAENIPNMYKGAFYQLVPVMEAHDITNTLKDDWSISSSQDEYLKTMYDDKLH